MRPAFVSFWLGDPIALASAAPSARPERRWAGAAVLCAVAGAVVVAGLDLGRFFHAPDDDLTFPYGSPVLPALPFALLAAKPLIAHVMSGSARARNVAGLALALFGALVAAATVVFVRRPIVDTPFRQPNIPHPAVVASLLAVAAALSVGAASRLLRSPSPPPGRVRALQKIAWAAAGLGAALVAASAWASRLPRPTLGAYVASLPVVAELPATDPGSGDTAPPWGGSHDGYERIHSHAKVGDVTIAMYLGKSLSVLREDAMVAGDPPWTPGSPLTVRRDAARGVIAIDSALARGAPGSVPGARAAFRAAALPGSDWVPIDLSGNLCDLTGPPLPWTLTAAAGVVLALAALGARGGTWRALRRNPSDWHEGRCDGAGWVALEHAPRCPMPAHLAGYTGAAVVVPRGPGRLGSYRTADGHGEVLVVACTIADLRRAIDVAEADRALLALAAVALGAAPLVAALVCGLVLPWEAVS